MSDNPPALITVRATSGRLPNKCFLPLGGIRVLDHVIYRVRAGGFRPIVCTSVEVSDDRIEAIAHELGVEVFRGDLENKLNRWKSCMQEFNLPAAHLVDADDPYFDPIEMHESYDFMMDESFNLVRTSIRSDSGFASVGTSIRFDFIQELVKRATSLKSSNFDVIPWDLLLLPEDLVAIMPDKNLGISPSLILRLTLDYPEDYELLSTLGKVFKVDTPRSEIESFLSNNKNLLEINLSRGVDFMQNKSNFISNHFE